MKEELINQTPDTMKELEGLLGDLRPQSLRIGEHTSRLPIIQGGMAVGISLSGLASAVANAGGIGVIAAAGIGMNDPDFYQNPHDVSIRCLKEEIKRAQRMTSGVLGVNIMVALSKYSEYVEAAVDEGIDIIFTGAGLPLTLPEMVSPDSRTKLVPIISSTRAARIIFMRWQRDYNRLPDGFVVEGPLAGGHLGFKAEELNLEHNKLENLVSGVIQQVKPFEESAGRLIPVIAAGGVYSGSDILKFLRLGASGIQMATRFVATTECDAHPSFKEAYLNASKEDIVTINSPVGMPGRAIRNKYIDSVMLGKKKPFKCPYHCVKTCNYKESPYCIFMALTNAQRGKLSGGFAFCGANVHRVKEITTVKKLMSSLLMEYRASVIDNIVGLLIEYMNDLLKPTFPQTDQATA
jgi:nitronate monooxygenase